MMSTETHLVDEWEPRFLLWPRRVVTVRHGDEVLEREWRWLCYAARRQHIVIDSVGEQIHVWHEYESLSPVAARRLKAGMSGRQFNDEVNRKT